MKLLITKQRSTVLFLLAIFILFGTYNTGYGQAIDPPLSGRTQQVQDAIVAAVPSVDAAADVTEAHLAAIPFLSLYSKSITSLKAGDLDGLTHLTHLSVSRNALTTLPSGIFDELENLEEIFLGTNALTTLPSGIFDELENLRYLYLNGNALTTLPSDIFDELENLEELDLSRNALTTLPAGVFDELSSLTTLYLNQNKIRDVSVLEDLTSLTALYLSRNPISDYGPLRRLVAAIKAGGGSLKLDITIPPEFAGGDGPPRDVAETPASAPVFAEGTTATRTVAENTASGINIGTVVAATDADNDTLTYTLSGTDASSFSIVSTSGQLQTRAALDYETKLSYSVTVSVSDGKGGSDSIDVRINVSNVNEAPSFTEGSSTTRSIAENTTSGTNVGSAVAATDVDADTILTYTLGGSDAASFSINSTNGQLQTNAALDYETKRVYAVSITVSDSKLTDSIDVSIDVTDVDENRAPAFAEGTSTTRSVAENTAAGQDIGNAVSATDPDDDTLTYTLGGVDAASFSINSTNGQLQTNVALDFETKRSYSVSITVSDSKLTDSIDVSIDVTDVDENRAPAFAEGTSTTRSVAENTAAGQNIGSAVSATDPDDDTLTYTLGGTDAASFSINSTNGQLQTRAALDYETKRVYAVSITVSDSKLTDSIDVSIDVTDVDENRAPSFAEGTSTTRAIAENTAANTNIGSAVSATDPDTSDTLTYTLGGTDAASFSINSTNGQLQTRAALDYETKRVYAVSITVSDSKLTDSIDVRINVTDVDENRAPSFAEGTSTTRSVAENTAAGQDIGSAVSATDPDDDTLTYTLSGADAASFSINSTNGQLQTNVALDFETKRSYSVSITVSDGQLTDSIDVSIDVTDVDENRAPAFAEGTSTTRSVAENTASGQNIGSAVSATDPDNDTLTYTLGGSDAASFSIVSASGQLQTNAALDYENKKSYSLTVSVSDSKGGSDSITVAINVTDVEEPVEQPPPPLSSGGTPPASTPIVQPSVEPNHAPVFSDGTSTTRSIAENTDSGVSIGTAVSATDADNDSLTYTLGGTDEAYFRIVSTSGQLQTHAALDYETKNAYTVTVSVSDGNGSSDSITVTINVTDVNESIMPVNQRTQQVQDAIVAAVPGVDNADDVTAEHLAGITELDLSYKRITSLQSGDFSGLTALTNLELWGNSISDISALEDLTKLTWLELHSNSISDISVLEKLTSLKTLDLSYTSISDISALEKLTTLTQLYLVHTSISDISVLEKLTSLSTLDLSYTSISNISALEDLTKLTRLRLWHTSISDISTLESLTALADLDLKHNSISDVSTLESLTALRWLSLSGNPISDYGPLRTLKTTIENAGNSINIDINITNNPPTKIDPPLSERAQQVRDVIVSVVDVDSVGDVTAAHLATISALSLNSAGIKSLKTGDFAGLTSLQYLHMNRNSISDISALEDLTVLRWLSLSDNSISDISALEDLTALTNLGLKNNSISDISALSGLTSLLRLHLMGNSITDVSALENLTSLKELYLRGNPIPDYGPLHRLTAANPGVSIDININNNPPVFTEGDSTTRTIAENTAPGTNIGNPIAATDADNDTLIYTLGGTDAESFSIVNRSGQLRTKAALDYEMKRSYTVTVDVSDGDGLDRIIVTINVSDVAGAAPSVEVSPIIPDKTALLTNFPNPFNPETWIPYQLAEPAEVTLTIYDIRGVVVRELKLGHQAAGVYHSRSRAIYWDGRNAFGEKVATGVYFYTLQAGDFIATRKLLIRK